jgi:hypothetical protein
MELPEDVCTFFAEKFNLTEDTGTGIYLANTSIANANSGRANISFVIQDDLGGSDEPTTITHPYDAFNASLHWSWGNPNESTIFPMRKMNKTAVLGRAFLQEAYLFANYEPDIMTLQLSQAVLGNPTSDIVSVYASRDVSSHPKKLHGGAIAGIAIGVVAALALISCAIWWFVRHKKKPRQEATLTETPTEKGDEFSSEGTYGRSEIDAVSPSIGSTMRPGYGHRRGESNVSELSSDSEQQAGHSLMGTLHELPVNIDAAELEECQGEGRRKDSSPQELEGSQNWSTLSPTSQPDWTGPSTHSTPTSNLQSSPTPGSPPRRPSVPERT